MPKLASRLLLLFAPSLIRLLFPRLFVPIDRCACSDNINNFRRPRFFLTPPPLKTPSVDRSYQISCLIQSPNTSPLGPLSVFSDAESLSNAQTIRLLEPASTRLGAAPVSCLFHQFESIQNTATLVPSALHFFFKHSWNKLSQLQLAIVRWLAWLTRRTVKSKSVNVGQTNKEITHTENTRYPP